MAYSKLYHTLLSSKFFLDLRQVEALSVLVDKFLRHDVDDFSAQPYSANHRLEVKKMDAALAQSVEGGQGDAQVVAVIPLIGTMIKYGTWCNYGADEIAEAIDEAAANARVCGIVLEVDSGGGSVDAIAPLIGAIQRAQAKGKPVVASCDLCASAAYYVACHCDEVMATNSISSEFGSIGVMMSFADYSKYYESEGIKVHTIYSNHSNYKNQPFELAREGKYDLIKTEQLDPLAQKFQEAVRERRAGKLDEKVEGILAGRVFFAEDSLANGLIDSIGSLEKAVARCRELVAEANINDFIHSSNL